ncbi:transglycosylase SLT domain-containing protein [Chelativorans sp.]|uniref:lytic transglycosylase domain-containing protein n=1 Tax=Chelativorans sp. TaxID=2203393 RepID=UPI0028109C87|nr:transglycosylase SLT domain-containing protein [Chelativorans sp.]
MKIKMVFAAAVAAGAMTLVSNIAQASEKTAPADAKAETSRAGGLGEAMKQVLRAGNAAAEAGGDHRPVPGGAKLASTDPKAGIDNTVTGSVKPSGKTDEKTVGTRPFHAIISQCAEHYGVPVSLAHAVVTLESNYRPKARGKAGEIGLMQIKPSTARMMGYSGSAQGLYEPETNIKYGMRYLGQAFKLGGGDTCSAILKYNAGHGAKRMNPISSAYCQKVKRLIGGK